MHATLDDHILDHRRATFARKERATNRQVHGESLQLPPPVQPATRLQYILEQPHDLFALDARGDRPPVEKQDKGRVSSDQCSRLATNNT